MSQSKDYYKILGIEKSATLDEIKKSYKKLAIRWHPDKNRENTKEAEEKFKEIAEAYAVLSDPEKRRNYDLSQSPSFHAEPGMGSFDEFGFNPDGIFGHRMGGFTFQRAEEIFKEFFHDKKPSDKEQDKNKPNPQPDDKNQYGKRRGNNLFEQDDASFAADPMLKNVFGSFGLNGFGNMAGFGGFPGFPGFPGFGPMPGMPAMPGMPGMPGMGGMPGLGGFPGFGGLGGLGGFPGFGGGGPMAPGSYRSFEQSGSTRTGMGGVSQSVSTSTIIRNGKKVTVTETTTRNPDGTSHTEVHEQMQDEAGNIKENKYVQKPEGQQQKVGYLPPSDTKDKENKEQQAQIQSKESQEKNGQQVNRNPTKKVKKDFTPPENSNVIDLT